VIIEVWLSGSEPTLIRRSALVQQLRVRKDPRSEFRRLIEDEIIIFWALRLVGGFFFHTRIHTCTYMQGDAVVVG